MLNWLTNLFCGDDTNSRIIIRSKGRDEWAYQEGEHKMVIYAELLSGDNGLGVDFGSIWKWLPPHDQKVLSWDERDRILKNFCAYLDLKKIKYTVLKQTGNLG